MQGLLWKNLLLLEKCEVRRRHGQLRDRISGVVAIRSLRTGDRNYRGQVGDKERSIAT